MTLSSDQKKMGTCASCGKPIVRCSEVCPFNGYKHTVTGSHHCDEYSENSTVASLLTAPLPLEAPEQPRQVIKIARGHTLEDKPIAVIVLSDATQWVEREEFDVLLTALESAHKLLLENDDAIEERDRLASRLSEIDQMHYAAEQEVELLEKRLSSALELAKKYMKSVERIEWSDESKRWQAIVDVLEGK